MRSSLSRLMVALALMALVSPLAFAQSSGKSSLSGTVTDSSGGVLPGVSVSIKSLATGETKEVTTNTSGAYSFVSLDPGKYTVTVSLSNFKTTKMDVTLVTAYASTIITKMEMGNKTDTVTVVATVDLIKTTDTTVSATISADQIAALPLVTRNALNFVTFLPGVDTTSTHNQRSSTVMGLPSSAISISIDGVNVQDQTIKSTDGFFAIIRPQTDLVEEVTVSEATPGADSSGQGAVQIKFVTRSGSNQHTGSVYEYYRSPWMNTNSPNNFLFNPTATPLPKNAITLNQYGIREGGPLVIPGMYDGHGKAFYFINYEEFRLPSNVTRSRTFLNPSAVAGNLNYGCSGGTCLYSANVLTVAAKLAAANPTVAGITTTVDPTMLGIFNFINASVLTQGTIVPNSDNNTSAYSWQPFSLRTEHLPGGRIDYNITNKHKLTGTYIFQKVNSNPDELNSAEPRFPGAPVQGGQVSYRNSGTETLRSTFTKNLTNEASFGFLWDPGYFFNGITAASGEFADQQNFAIAFNSVGSTPTTLTASNGGSARNGWDWEVDDSVNWLKGTHSLQFGENFTTVGNWATSNSAVPNVALGVNSTLDPVGIIGMFTTANFPNATSGELTSATNLYAMLTGRITSIGGYVARQADGTYAYFVNTIQRVKQKELGLFTQDTWRLKPNFTVNMGVRWELEMPFSTEANTYSKNDLADVCGLSGQGSGLAVGTLLYTTGAANAANGTTSQKYGGRPYCNFLSPGTLPALASDGGAGLAKIPTYEAYTAGSPGYATHYNNFSPSFGVAWQPNVQHGFGRRILGDPAQATVRASFARTFNRDGLAVYSGSFSGNPGLTRTMNENTSNGNFPPDNGAWPVLLSQPSRLIPPTACPAGVPSSNLTCFQSTFDYTLPAGYVGTQGVRAIDPQLQLAYSNSYSVGFSRALGRDMAMEIRYVGTQNRRGVTTEGWNEVDLYNNAYGTSSSFLNEFTKASNNLQLNLAYAAAGNTTFPNGQKIGANNSFADTGVTGTQPLPIMLAYWQGLNSAVAGDPTKYTAVQFTNSTLVNALGLHTQNPFTFAGTGSGYGFLGSSAFTLNAQNAGLSANFFVMNPSVGSANNITTADPTGAVSQTGTLNVLTNGNFTNYNSLQLILSRRLSRGLQFSVNYVYAVGNGSTLLSIYLPRVQQQSTGVTPQALKMVANYDVPIGRGKRYGANMDKWLDEVVGGWSVNLTGVVQSGAAVNYGNVTLHGMTLSQLQKMFKYYKGPDGFWYDLPQNVLLNSQKAFSTSALTTDGYSVPSTSLINGVVTTIGGAPDPTIPYIGPVMCPAAANSYGATAIAVVETGDCGGTLNTFIHAPIFTRFNLSAKKTFPFAKRANFQLEVDFLNVFNAIDFNPNTAISGGTFPSSFRVSSGYSDVSNTFDPGGRIGQLAFRINW